MTTRPAIFTELQIELASRGYIRSKFITLFQKDLLRIKIIKRQLSRYSKTKKLNLRLFLNNLILFFNAFDTTIGKALIYDCISEKEYRSVLKTCLVQLQLMQIEEWMDVPIYNPVAIELKILLS